MSGRAQEMNSLTPYFNASLRSNRNRLTSAQLVSVDDPKGCIGRQSECQRIRIRISQFDRMDFHDLLGQLKDERQLI